MTSDYVRIQTHTKYDNFVFHYHVSKEKYYNLICDKANCPKNFGEDDLLLWLMIDNNVESLKIQLMYLIFLLTFNVQGVPKRGMDKN